MAERKVVARGFRFHQKDAGRRDSPFAAVIQFGMRFVRRCVPIIAVVVSGVFVCACSSDTGEAAPTTTTRTVPVGASYRGEAKLTGAINASGKYRAEFVSANPETNSCERVDAPNEPGTFSIPMPTTLDGYRIQAVAAANPFRGAGRYGRDEIKRVTIAVKKVGSERAAKYVSASDSTAELVVAGDGSGAFNFAGLTGPSGTLSGVVTWTCR
jgi:hypothetical protein